MFHQTHIIKTTKSQKKGNEAYLKFNRRQNAEENQTPTKKKEGPSKSHAFIRAHGEGGAKSGFEWKGF